MKRLTVVLLAVLLPACTPSSRGATPSPSETTPAPSPSGTPSPGTPSPSVSTTASPAVSPPAAPRAVPRGFEPRSASFVTARHGWVLGATRRTAAVVETRDGGRTWSLAGTLPAPAATQFDAGSHVRQLRFLSERVGWAYGNRTYVTRDGGATWREAALPEGRTMVSIAATGERTYALLGRVVRYAVEDAAVWNGTVDGETFVRTDTRGAPAPSYDVVVRGRTVVFVLGAAGYRVSNDAGRTWATHDPCPSDQALQSVAAATERDLFFACVSTDEHGWERSLHVSRDGGRTTRTRLAESAWSAGDVAAPYPDVVVWALDPQGTDDGRTLLWSGDGGRTFRSVGPVGERETVDWDEPRFHEGAFGTVVRRVSDGRGSFYAVYATRDGGRTWARLPVG